MEKNILNAIADVIVIDAMLATAGGATALVKHHVKEDIKAGLNDWLEHAQTCENCAKAVNTIAASKALIVACDDLLKAFEALEKAEAAAESAYAQDKLECKEGAN